VKRLFEQHKGKYGSPRIAADLRDVGWRVSQNTVARLMREQHLAARQKRKRKSTTRPGRGRWRAPDLVKRDVQINRMRRVQYRALPSEAGSVGAGRGPARRRPRACASRSSPASGPGEYIFAARREGASGLLTKRCRWRVAVPDGDA